MSRFVIAASIVLLAAGTARAEPPADEAKADKAKADKAKADKAKADKAKADKAKAKPRTDKRPDLVVPNKSPARPVVDLFPSSVFGTGAPGRVGGTAEKRYGMSLGNDTWKTHVAQIGVMAVGWAALVGLCGKTKCMLPKSLTGWLPSAFKAKPFFVPEPRPPQKIRNAGVGR